MVRRFAHYKDNRLGCAIQTRIERVCNSHRRIKRVVFFMYAIYFTNIKDYNYNREKEKVNINI